MNDEKKKFIYITILSTNSDSYFSMNFIRIGFRIDLNRPTTIHSAKFGVRARKYQLN